MAESPKYSVRNQTNTPHIPEYQNQYLQMQINSGAYACNNAHASFLQTDIAPGSQILPIYQEWNQNANIPLLPNTQNEKIYKNTKAYKHQNNPKFHQPATHPDYNTSDSVRNISKLVEFSDTRSEKDFNNVQLPMNHFVQPYAENNLINFMGNVQANVNIRDDNYDSHLKSDTELIQIPDNEYTERSQRQESDSYSPCVTPMIHNSQVNSDLPSNTLSAFENGIHNEGENRSTGKLTVDSLSLSKSPPRHANVGTERKSIVDCREMAQRAILNLWPYGVGFETYLEEGFKKELIEKLFEDLKIDKYHLSNAASLQKISTNQIFKTPIDNENKRNDSLQSHNESSLQVESNSPTSDVNKKPSEMAEKEKTLQSKMEALRKSREARASAKTGAKSHNDQTFGKQTKADQVKSINSQHNLNLPVNSVSTSIKSTDPIESQTKIPLHSISKTVSNYSLNVNIENSTTKTLTKSTSEASSDKPAIPGLFLVSNLADSTLKPSLEDYNKQRKRPVASDFDENINKKTPFKRPFGHNRSEQRIVINVSDDESEDEDVSMELESQLDQESPIISSMKNFNMLQNMTSASHSPGLNTFTPPLNLSTLQFSASGKQSFSAPCILKQKQREIQLMKKKIAVAEAQLKAKSVTGSVGTRHQSESSISEIKENSDYVNTLPKNSETCGTKLDMFTDRASQDKTNIDQTEKSKTDNVNEPTESEGDKFLRRQKIADKLPLIESEVQKGRSRLEQLKVEIAQVEAGIQKNLEKRQRIASEMERLNVEQAHTSLSNEFLKVQTEKSDYSNPLELPVEEDSIPFSSTSQEREIGLNNPTPRLDLPNSSTAVETAMNPVEIENTPRNLSSVIDVINIEGSEEDKLDEENIKTSKIIMPQYDDHVMNIKETQTPPQALQEALKFQVENSVKSTTSESNKEIPCDSKPALQEIKTSNSPIEEGELSSEYTPEFAAMDGIGSESDNYEPPDPTVLDRISSIISPPFSPAPSAPVELTKTNQVQTINNTKLCILNEGGNNTESPTQRNVVSQQIPDGPNFNFYSSDRYTPYQSPLQIFRAYRFHPNFKNEVAGGLRSVTYSHKIDANKEFCRFEMAGGICNDLACNLQHFKSITLPDDGIMAALGSPDEFSGDRREKFVAGLREVLLDLRLRKINDFDIIASEIIAHRVKFLGDKSKVLALEGVNI